MFTFTEVKNMSDSLLSYFIRMSFSVEDILILWIALREWIMSTDVNKLYLQENDDYLINFPIYIEINEFVNNYVNRSS